MAIGTLRRLSEPEFDTPSHQKCVTSAARGRPKSGGECDDCGTDDRLERVRRGAVRLVALRNRDATAAARGDRRRHHHRRRGLSPRLRRHRHAVAWRFPERPAVAAGNRAARRSPIRQVRQEGCGRCLAGRRIPSPPPGTIATRPHARHAPAALRGRLHDTAAACARRAASLPGSLWSRHASPSSHPCANCSA